MNTQPPEQPPEEEPVPTAEAEAPEAPPKDPYAPPSQEERDRLAAEVERRRADEPTGPMDVPGADLEPSEEFKARIKALMESVPYHDAEGEEPVDALDELRTKTFEQAWTNSLRDARVDDLEKWTLDQLAGDQSPDVLRGFVDNIGRKDTPVLTLILAGRVGPGKTSAAIAAGNAAAARGLLVRFVRHATYLNMLRPEGAPADMPDWQIRRRFRDCHLLILDDLGAEQDADVAASRFVREETLSLIGDRAESGKPTILTTNESSTSLTQTLGERLVSRLSQRGHVVSFNGPDRRGRLSWGGSAE